VSALVPVERPVRLPRGRGRGLLSALAPAAVLGVVLLLSWQLVVLVGGVQAYLLPAPSAIAQVVVGDASALLSAARPTATAVVLAVLAGAALGVLASVVIAMFEGVARVVLALVALAGCAPIVALAPIFNAWLGSTSIASKVAVATLSVTIPVVVNTTRGLLAVSPTHREYMQSVSASRRQLLVHVRLPGALPALFDGLRVGATLSVIAVIVSEYFGGTSNALGVLIANTAAMSRFDQTWAAVFVASLLGLSLYGLIALVERLAVPWRTAASG
jgi:NitT/TauT family transport system permease protein